MKNKFKTGAASFYVVAFSTLILVIIAASFASAIVMEIARSSNDELAQSAYDAAIAGVEDAKVAFINYQNCVNSGAKASEPDNDGKVSCGEIIWWVENESDSCDMVAHILGRIGEKESGEVAIEETTGTSNGGGSNNMNQAYTCTLFKTSLSDYRADLNSINPYRIVKVDLAENYEAKDIKRARLSWYSNTTDTNYSNVIINGENEAQVGFQPLESADGVAKPPTLMVQLIQTDAKFNLTELNGKTIDGKTDRATVYLVPSNGALTGSDEENNTFINAWDGKDNVVTRKQFADTNNHAKNYPFVVNCEEGTKEFLCSVVLQLPEPIGGDRNSDTFVFAIALPYGQPATAFSLELLCGENGDEPCNSNSSDDSQDDSSAGTDSTAKLGNMQVLIDSTGRANDLYRRVEIRLGPNDDAFNIPIYAVQVEDEFEKDFSVETEWSSDSYSNYYTYVDPVNNQ